METKQRKVIDHKFLNKHTIPGLILLMIWGLIFPELIISTPFALVDMLISKSGDVKPLFSSFAAAGGAFLVLAIHKHWFYPEFEGCLKCSQIRFKDACMTAAAIIPFWVISAIKEFASGNKMMAPTLYITGMSLMAGCCEEAAFRGLGISYLMRQWKEESKILPALLITSSAFGFVHGSNIIAGAGAAVSVLQIISAFFMGLFLGAVFLRTGNLWPAIIIHFIQDVFAGMVLAEEYVLNHVPGWSDVIDLLLCAVLGVIGFYLIRKEKHAEIVAIWHRKWNMNK